MSNEFPRRRPRPDLSDGALDDYYRGRMREFSPDSEWRRLPSSLRKGLVGGALRRLMADAEEELDRPD